MIMHDVSRGGARVGPNSRECMCWPALAFSRTGQCGNSDSPHWPVPYLNFPHW
eukprot:COSAG06_NODE_1725_length_8579_cov_14.164151_1_plen_52_part_10